jgi:hypothetical protein
MRVEKVKQVDDSCDDASRIQRPSVRHGLLRNGLPWSEETLVGCLPRSLCQEQHRRQQVLPPWLPCLRYWQKEAVVYWRGGRGKEQVRKSIDQSAVDKRAKQMQKLNQSCAHLATILPPFAPPGALFSVGASSASAALFCSRLLVRIGTMVGKKHFD